jgi:hypothetical protein
LGNKRGNKDRYLFRPPIKICFSPCQFSWSAESRNKSSWTLSHWNVAMSCDTCRVRTTYYYPDNKRTPYTAPIVAKLIIFYQN